jgi:hypothetical protein
MPRAQAQALARTFKQGLMVASVLTFGTLSALVAHHVTGVTMQPSSAASTTSGDLSPTSPSSGGFFQQQLGGFGFGSNSTGQGPVTSSGVS